MMEYIDTHAHLGMLEHAPTEDILMRAHHVGVSKMVTVSTDEGSWESNRNFAKKYPNIFYSLGLHPHDSIRWAQCAFELNRLVSEKPAKCVAIGETGLDFHYDFSPRDVQLDVFESQLAMAKSMDLPVIVHCRDAFGEVFESIKKIGLSSRGGVMHCFTGNAEQAKHSVSLGMKISFSGILTFKNADVLREAAKAVPTTEILLETDCPFLSPEPYRGKPNEPFHLPVIAQKLGAVLNVSIQEIAEITTRNAHALFDLS